MYWNLSDNDIEGDMNRLGIYNDPQYSRLRTEMAVVYENIHHQPGKNARKGADFRQLKTAAAAEGKPLEKGTRMRMQLEHFGQELHARGLSYDSAAVKNATAEVQALAEEYKDAPKKHLKGRILDEYLVEKILKERRNGKHETEYLVQWAAGDQTWEPASCAEGTTALHDFIRESECCVFIPPLPHPPQAACTPARPTAPKKKQTGSKRGRAQRATSPTPTPSTPVPSSPPEQRPEPKRRSTRRNICGVDAGST